MVVSALYPSGRNRDTATSSAVTIWAVTYATSAVAVFARICDCSSGVGCQSDA